VVATPHAVYVADAHGGRLLQANPKTAKVERIAELSPGPITPVVGAGWIWSSSAADWGDATRDDRVLRIDPATLRVVQTLHLGGNVPLCGLRVRQCLSAGGHRIGGRAHPSCGLERPTD
jgi:hypothetical protein